MSDETEKPRKKTAKDRGLGRGLSALMADISVPETTAEPVEPKSAAPVEPSETKRTVQFVSIARITRNPDQPRKRFNKEDLEELTESIRLKGVLQPILVRPLPESERSEKTEGADYQIVAGERRWQASLAAGLDAMPVLIRELSDREVLEIGVVENVQRADLTPMEEARAYRALMDDFGRTQADVAAAVGKSRPHVANLMKFLDLPLIVQRQLELGRITMGHGRALANVPDPVALGQYIVDNGLTVRQTEQLAKELREGKPGKMPPPPKPGKDADILRTEADLSDVLGLGVDLRHRGHTGGELRLKYRTLEQLEDVIRRLKG